VKSTAETSVTRSPDSNPRRNDASRTEKKKKKKKMLLVPLLSETSTR
jgi:hypothetical protein